MTGAILAAVLVPSSGQYRTRGRHRKPPSHRYVLVRRWLAAGGATAVLAGLVVLAGLLVTWPTKVGAPMSGTRAAPPVSAAAPPPARSEPARTTATPLATDARGFTQSGPRCAPAQTALAVGRTPSSLLVICAADDGRYEYVGVRLSDSALLRTAVESTTARGFVARHHHVRYAVSPTELLVTVGATVLKREPMIEFTVAGSHAATVPR